MGGSSTLHRWVKHDPVDGGRVAKKALRAFECQGLSLAQVHSVWGRTAESTARLCCAEWADKSMSSLDWK